MVGRKHNHPHASSHNLHLHRGRRWQANPNQEYEQKPDVHTLPDEKEISQRQVHPSSQENQNLLITNSCNDPSRPQKTRILNLKLR